MMSVHSVAVLSLRLRETPLQEQNIGPAGSYNENSITEVICFEMHSQTESHVMFALSTYYR